MNIFFKTVCTSIFVLCTVWSFGAAMGAQKAPDPWRVHSVQFSGNIHFKRYELLNRIELKPTLLRRGPRFSMKKLENDIDIIKHAYESQGFLMATVNSGITRDSLRKNVAVLIEISEGVRAMVGGVTYSGWYPDSSTAEQLSCKKGKPLLTADINHDERTLELRRREEGYLSAAVITRHNADSSSLRVDLDFYVHSGSIITVDTIILEGVNGLRPDVVMRELSFLKKDTLTSKKITKTERKLYQTNLFNSVAIEPVLSDSTSEKSDLIRNRYRYPILISCKEANFFRLKLGSGYGSQEKFRGSLETSYSNLFKLGHQISLKGNISQLLQQVQSIYSTPWFLGVPLRFDGKLYYNRFSDKSTYQGEFRGINVSLEKSLDYNILLHFLTTWEDVVWITSEGLPKDLPAKNTQSFGVDMAYDSRNDLMDPEKGVYSFTKVECAGLAARNSNQFVKVTHDVRFYGKLRLLSLATGVKFGWVRPFGTSHTVPLQAQFYAGGSKSVRGFRDNYLRTSNDSLHHAKSGTTLLTANCLECRFPLIGYLNGAFFVDAGFLGDRVANLSLNSFLHEVRWTAGPGLRLKTPLAIVRADLGIKLGKEPGEGRFQWHLDIGQAF